MKIGFNKLTDYTVRFDVLKRDLEPLEYCARIDTGKSDHNGIGATPAEALLNAASHWYGHEQRQREIERAKPCPKCTTGKLLSQRGGGVACNTTCAWNAAWSGSAVTLS